MELDYPVFEDQNKDDIFYTQIDEDLDFAIALSLQSDYNSELKENTSSNKPSTVSKAPKHGKASEAMSIVDKQWELLDPNPDIHALFLQFNKQFFWDALMGIEVRWSPRMTLCAGVCCYEGRGGLCSVRLSLPLLKLRPRRDLVETLLHEMIHAYLFVTHNNKDHDAHGPEFLKHMHRINQETGTKISVYHSFHDEVDFFRKHWWKCNGPCQKKSPFYGVVKRAMNRAPGPKDPWWAAHQSTCGGTYIKIKEPEDYNQKKTSKRKADDEPKLPTHDIREFFNGDSKKPKETHSNVHTISSNPSEKTAPPQEKTANVHTISSQPKQSKNIIPFSGSGFQLGSASDSSKVSNLLNLGFTSPATKLPGSFTSSIKNKSTSSRIQNLKNKGQSKTDNFSGFNRGGTKLATSSGSSTIVINPPTQKKPRDKSKDDAKKKPTFNSKGHTLGEPSGTQKKPKERVKTPVKSSNEKFLQSPIEKYFAKSPSKSTKPKDNNVIPPSFELLSDSDESLIIGSPRKNGGSRDTGSRESVVAMIKCPACDILVPDEDINVHLDSCLIMN